MRSFHFVLNRVVIMLIENAVLTANASKFGSGLVNQLSSAIKIHYNLIIVFQNLILLLTGCKKLKHQSKAKMNVFLKYNRLLWRRTRRCQLEKLNLNVNDLLNVLKIRIKRNNSPEDFQLLMTKKTSLIYLFGLFLITYILQRKISWYSSFQGLFGMT